ncbi:MAG: alkaline phosphatase family protein [Candidatus Bipolaricaulia bacterium]
MNTFVFAIDGASPNLVNKWIKEGHLPNLKKIKDQGVSGKLKSTFPPLTGPAWSSFQTGVNPGKHGVFNWLTLNDSYKGKVINRTSIKTRTVWKFISSQGGKVGLVSLPVTYPPEKVNGFIIPGFLTPKNSAQRSYPKQLLGEVESSFPEFNSYVDEYMGGSKEDWVTYLTQSVQTRGEAGRFLFKKDLQESTSKHNHSLFLTHFFATDLVQHFLWDRVEENWDPRLEVFKKVDEEIGKTMEMASNNSSFLVVSDHGFGPVKRIFNVNNWLREEGYLKVENTFRANFKQVLSKFGVNQHKLKPLGEKIYPVVKNLGLVPNNVISASSHPALKAFFLSDRDVNWEETSAYSRSDIGHIRLNMSGREKEGWIDQEKGHSILSGIRKKLEKIKVPEENTNLTEWVKKKEDIYYGPYLKDAPDLLFNPLPSKSLGFGASMFLSEDIFVNSFKPGNHRINGILMASGPSVQPGGRNASITDIAPTLLNLFGYPVPEQMDGEVIREIAPKEPSYYRPKDFYKSRKIGEEVEDSREKLEHLGYL